MLWVRVNPSPSRPHYVVDAETRRRTAYLRIEDMSVEASHEARRLMRATGESENVLLKMGRKERILLQHIEAVGRITVQQFVRLARIPRGSASRTLVRMTRARILTHHADVREDYFTSGAELAQVGAGS